MREFCPTSGKIVAVVVPDRHDRGVSSASEDAQRRLQVLLGLSPELAARAVAETLDCFQVEVDAYIVDRHAELQAQGEANPDIFERIAAELGALRFRAPALSARQIRRRIYG